MNNISVYVNKIKYIIGHAGLQIIQMLVGLLRNKLIALNDGVNGVGAFGLLQNLLSIVVALACLGRDTSLVREISKNGGSNRSRIRKTYFPLINRVAIYAGFLGLILFAMLAGKEWSDAKWFIYNYPFFVLAGALLAVGTISTAILKGEGRVDLYYKSTILTSLLSLILFVTVQVTISEPNLAIYLLIPAICSLASYFYLMKVLPKHEYVSINLNKRRLIKEIKSGAPLVLANISGLVSGFAGRLIILNFIGEYGLGLYHAASGVASMVFLFIFVSINSDYVVNYKKKNDKSFFGEVLFNSAQYIVLGFLVAIVCIAWAEELLELVYTNEFSAAVSLLKYLLVGEAIRVISVSIEYVEIIKGRYAIYSTIKVVQSFLNVAIIVILLKYWGFDGLKFLTITSSSVTLIMLGILNAKCKDIKVG